MKSTNNESKSIDLKIPVWTVVKVVLVLVALYLLYSIGNIIVMLFVALILTALIGPFADWFEKNKIPRTLAVLLIYVVLFGAVGTAIVLLVPPLLHELSELVKNFAVIWERVVGVFVSARELSAQYGIAENIARGLESLERGLTSTITSALGTIRGFFGGLISFLIVLVLTFYMVVEEDSLRRSLKSIVPSAYHSYLTGLFGRVQDKMGLWLRGEIILMVVVGLFSYVGLLILDVDYALILGILAGFAELIPYAGPVIAAIPAVILAFTQAPIKALFVIVLYFAIQQLENHLLVPKVMQRAVGLNPIISIVSLLVGAQLFGVLGAILAIPVATALSVVFNDLFEEEKGA